ncbi:MAG: NAD-dependent epimerase/dehydratase family protein, partial [bacterium]
GFGPRQRAELETVNAQGTETLLRAAWENRVERVLHVSTAGILVNHGGIITEEHFPEKPPFGCHYKSSKWRAEKRALEWARRGLPVVIACPTCPIGAGDERPTPTGGMIRDFLRGKFPFSSRTGLNFIGVQDLADGLLATIEKGRIGHRYILGQENLWLEEFLALLAAATKLPAPRLRLPLSLITILGVAGECADLLTRRTNGRLCIETALQARRRQFFDPRKAKEELGWRPAAPLANAVQEAVEWFRPLKQQT